MVDELFDDVWGLSENLRDAWTAWDALAAPESTRHESLGPDNPKLAQAAWELAVAVGRCRLFAFVPPSVERALTIPVSAGDAALRPAHTVAVRQTRSLGELSDRLLEATTSFEQHELAIEVLTRRVDIQAALLAIHDAATQDGGRPDLAGSSGEPTGAALPAYFWERLHVWQTAVGELDERMEEYGAELSVAAETYWVINTAAVIAAARQWTPLPWWLTPEIDEVYEESRQAAEALRLGGELDTAELTLQTCEWNLDALEAEDGGRNEDRVIRPASTETRSPALDAAEELVLKADRGDKPTAYRTMARFAGSGRHEPISLELRVNAAWAQVSPMQLPEHVRVRAVLRIAIQGHYADLQPPSSWRLRLGPLIKTVRLEDELGGSLMGSLDLTGGEMRTLITHEGLRQTSVRRIG